MILGCGGLGSWVACGLTCAGVGELVLIDDDRVERSNLNRQLLFGESDVGEAKTEAARRALRETRTRSCGVETVERRVHGPGDLADVLEGSDLLIATADWPAFELPRWVNRACIDAGVPYISGGQFLPLSRVGPTVVPGRTACLECEERRIRRDFPLYDEMASSGPRRRPRQPRRAPAASSARCWRWRRSTCSAARSSPPASAPPLILDMRTMEMTRERTERDPDARPAAR